MPENNLVIFAELLDKARVQAMNSGELHKVHSAYVHVTSALEDTLLALADNDKIKAAHLFQLIRKGVSVKEAISRVM